MELFLSNQEEISKSLENDFKVYYLNDKPYIKINSLEELEKNKFIFNFERYSVSCQFKLMIKELERF